MSHGIGTYKLKWEGCMVTLQSDKVIQHINSEFSKLLIFYSSKTSDTLILFVGCKGHLVSLLK